MFERSTVVDSVRRMYNALTPLSTDHSTTPPPHHTVARRRRSLFVGALVVASMGLFVPQATSAIQSPNQNEVTVNRVFDGTGPFDNDVLDNGAGVHTPGLDQGPTNNVVRTHDGFGVRVDWDVNEAAATDLTVVVSVSNGVSSPATDGRVKLPPEGFVAGCDPAKSSVSADQLSYTCYLGNRQQGEHGAIYPIFTMDNGLDGTLMNVTASLDSAESEPTTSGPVSFIVSATPKGDWLKKNYSVKRVTGAAGDGYVVLFPLILQDLNQVDGVSYRGTLPITADVFDIYDHGYNLPVNSTLATPAQMASAGFTGQPCGNYDAGNNGAFPSNPLIAITCTPEAGAPYPLTKLTITPDASLLNPAKPIIKPATLADGTPNYVGYIYAAQIAFFVPLASADANKSFDNVLSAKAPLIDPTNPVITAVPINATGKDVETSLTNNASIFTFGSGGGGGGGAGGTGTHFSHYGLFSQPSLWGPYNRGLPSGVLAYNPWWVPVLPEPADPLKGTIGYQNYGWKPWQPALDGAAFWDGNGAVTRNMPINMNLVLTTATTSSTPPTTPIHGCMTWSLDQVNLTPMKPLTLDIANTNVVAPNGSTGNPSNPNFSGTVPAPLPTNKFDYVLAGQAPPDGYSKQYGYGSLGPTLTNALQTVGNMPDTLNYPTLVPFQKDAYDKGLKIIVEYAQDPTLGTSSTSTPKFDAAINSVDCNNVNADSGFQRKWVDLNTLSAADLKTYEDADQPGTYRFNMVRVRTEGPFPWSSPWNSNTLTGASGIILSVSGITGNDLPNVNKDDTEIYLHTSRSMGDWFPERGQDAPKTTSCSSWVELNPPMFDKAIEDAITANGGTTDWCNMRYNTSADLPGNTALTTLDLNSFSWAAVSPVTSSTPAYQTGDSDNDRVTIVGVRPNVVKTNAAGLYAIAGNGDQVTFKIDLSAVGASIEALSNVKFTDVLDARYRFVSMTGPSSPGATCTTPPVGETGTISCQLSEPNPAVDSGPLLQGLPGGWTDSITLIVQVQNAAGATNAFSNIRNVAAMASTGTGLWDRGTGTFADVSKIGSNNQSAQGVAYSYLPWSYSSGKIVKATSTGQEPCTVTPPSAPRNEVWAERCALTSIDPGATNVPTNDEAGNMPFTLNYTNTGSQFLTNLRIIDVLPYNGDNVEPASNSATPVAPGTNGAKPSTVGDGRTPASQFAGQVGFKSASLSFSGASPTIASDPKLVTYLYTADQPSTISRDPDKSVLTNTWCSSDGKVVYGTGACPTDYTFGVTAVMAVIPKVAPNETATLAVTLDAEANSCSSLYTNTFGSRVNQIWLPVRSNDVSYMVNCKFDQAIQKRVASSWKPGSDGSPWITYGKSTVDFEIEVINQGDLIQDIDVTDYVDTKVFKYFAADNPGGTSKPGTLGATKTGPALKYTWTGADGEAKPVAKIVGKLAKGESIIIPIRLRVISLNAPMVNHSEISRFDDDGNTNNGDSNPANPNNTTAGPLVDIDSTPDNIFGNDVEIDNKIDLTPATGDEDDEDIALVPLLYSVGNQVWNDANNNGKVDAGEAPIKGVSMLLFKDANGDGVPDDNNGDKKVTEADSIATTLTDDKGLYLFSNLQPGGYVIAVAKSNFEVGAVLTYFDSSGPTSATPNDNIDQDDNGVTNAALGNVISGTITLGGEEPANEPGPRNDANADLLSNLTVDFGFYQPNFDLALRKVLSTNSRVTVGELVTFNITVFNQGTVPANNIHVVDYPPATLVLADSKWTTGSDGYPYIDLVGTLNPGQSTVIPITFRTTAAKAEVNHAEIAVATAVDAAGKPLTYQNGKPVMDIDSTPDAIPGDIEIDDEINLTPATGDEDDEDVAYITVFAKVIPKTGGETKPMLAIASIVLGGGLVAVVATRRRRRTRVIA